MQSAPEARQAWIRALAALGAMQRDPALTLPTLFEDLARTHGDRSALVGADERFSVGELSALMMLIARWATAQCPGLTVGLLMPNRPAFVALWLGLTRAGCVAALLNPNLIGTALADAADAGGCSLIIADDTKLDALDGRIPVLSYAALTNQLQASAEMELAAPQRPDDTALLVFTSGTTGRPKAARVSHGRVLEWALWFGAMLDLGPQDRIYDCLPLYHSTGGVVAIGAALVRGASVLIAPSFRASRFWDEVVEHDCTVFFYIGELCRYLSQTPAHAAERAHRVRIACGNGLQAGVWERMQERFGIPQILEFYAATEGNVSLYNCEGLPGAIGRVPRFLRDTPFALIRLDPSGDPVRDGAGRCVRVLTGEPGEAIGRVERTGIAARRFDGYTDAAATSGKLLDSVFAPGDRWFRSGDLMRQDNAGFVFFVDRLGDTFRWKGENVSTAEVAALIRRCPGVSDAVVYGVPVAGQEGKAGMVALAPLPSFDLVTLWAHVGAVLPGYARPVFLRKCAALAMTATFKLSTAVMAKEGVAASPEPVWVADREAGAYVPCDRATMERIEAGLIRL